MYNSRALRNLILIVTIFAHSTHVLAGPTVEEFLKTIKDENEVREKAELKQRLDYESNPLSKYLTRDQFQKFKQQAIGKDDRSEMLEGKLITINTADAEGCKAIRTQMNLDEDVCKFDDKNPLVSIIVMKPVQSRDEFERKISFSKMSPKEKVLLESVTDFAILGAGAFGIIYSLPESVSKWDKSKGFSALASQYTSRIKAGPVIDNDDWAINYIGHPISGAIYYTMVRHQGFSPLESAAFSFAMSTFFWEYGIEAIAEVPSVQDLILTPLIGSIIGEAFYSWGNTIENNGGKLLGSKALGKTATVLMNPAGSIAKKINRIFEYKVIKSSEFSLVTRAKTKELNGLTPTSTSTYFGLQLKFKY